MKERTQPYVSAAPFAHAPQSTASLSLAVLAALSPSLIWGAWLFGPRAFLVLGVSAFAALASEAAANLLSRRLTLRDGTALLTGVLVGASMPPGVPLHIPAAASAFGILIVKWSFGGLGRNWMNPALAGVAFAHLNWSAALSGAWFMPRVLSGVDGLSATTPLGYLRAADAASRGSPLESLLKAGYPSTALDARLGDWLNASIFEPLGAELPRAYVDLALGFRPGAIGEVAGLLLLAASVFLIARRIVRWEAPLFAFLSFAALVKVFGASGEDFLAGDVLFSIFTGSFLLLVFFLATDPVTSPVSSQGLALYGLGVGSLVFILRRLGGAADGGAFAVLAMNCVVPLIDRLLPAVKRRSARV